MKNIKNTIAILLIIFLASMDSLHAVNVSIDRFATCTNLNLGSKNYPIPKDNWGEFNGYDNNNMIGVVCVGGSNYETIVEFSSDWVLTSASDPSLKRPFSVCLIPRAKDKIKGDENYPNMSSKQFPLYGYSSTESSQIFTLPQTDGRDITTQYSTYEGCVFSWIDVVMVMDPPLNADGTLPGASTSICNVATADDYMGSISVMVTTYEDINGIKTPVSQSMTFFINGYYNSDSTYKPEKSEGILIVTPNAANVNAFDIASNKNVPVQVATTSFATMSYTHTTEAKYYMYVSSSSTFSDTGSQFMFKRTNSSGASTAYNSVNYEIIATNTRTGLQTTFNGYKPANTSGMILSTATRMFSKNKPNGFYNYELDTNLELKVTGNTDKLLAGAYSTNIYVHIVTGL